MAPDAIVILHNIRSLHNVGSVFRTADAAGVSKIYLTGYTPSPLDEMRRPRPDIVKTALGAERTVSWEKVASLARIRARLRREGYALVALECTADASDYRSYQPSGPFALLIGNEVRGLSPRTLRACDAVIQIPMTGAKESLNVAVAFGVAIYRLRFP